jgi:hypothetical protein
MYAKFAPLVLQGRSNIIRLSIKEGYVSFLLVVRVVMAQEVFPRPFLAARPSGASTISHENINCVRKNVSLFFKPFFPLFIFY